MAQKWLINSPRIPSILLLLEILKIKYEFWRDQQPQWPQQPQYHYIACVKVFQHKKVRKISIF